MTTRWKAGYQWGPASSEATTAYWGPVDAPAGRPVVSVSIDGILQPEVTAASWKLGRDGWFGDLTPCGASITFAGPATGEAGDEVIISTDTGLLWTGVLENISTSKRLGDGAYTSSVTAVDGLGRHGMAKMTTELNLSGYTLVTLLPVVLTELGMDPVTITEGDSATALPTLTVEAPTLGKTFLEYLQLAERSSNALMTLQPDGSLLAVTRDEVVAASVEVLTLVGDNAPRAWTVATDKSTVINHWSLVDANDVNRLEETDTDSVDAYGESTYEISEYMAASVTHFPATMRAAVTVPRPIATGEFPIFDASQAVLHLSPLDWVTFDGDTWQVMSVEHSVTPGEWTVSIVADVSQNAMADAPDPTPDEPDPEVTLDTQTLTSTKSAVVVRTDGGTNAGNGAGNYLPVGLYQGYRHRALIDFTGWSWPSGFIRVRKARLNLRTSGQVWVAFGSRPRFYAKRITESWSEGTYDAAIGSQYSNTNAVVWPGPSKSTAGQTLKKITDAEDNDISVDVTDIMQRAHDAGTFHGIMLISANEDSNVNCIEFISDDHGTSAYRPELVLTCETA